MGYNSPPPHMCNRAKGALASIVSGSLDRWSARRVCFVSNSTAGQDVSANARALKCLREASCQPERGVQVQPQESVGEKKRLISDRANMSVRSSGTHSSPPLCVWWIVLDKRINFVRQRSQYRGPRCGPVVVML